MKRLLSFTLCTFLVISLLPGCTPQPAQTPATDKLGNGWPVVRSMELTYATQFAVDFFDGDYALLSLSDGSRFLLVPEEGDIPSGLAPDITVLSHPVQNIYLVATASMCLFDALDSLDSIRLSGTKAEDWYIENARRAMEEGTILYAGKYNAPDYERILTEGCDLSIQSTMISHKPEVKEMLESLGIPVLVDQSSYEAHPLGRTEWIKLYGVLTGREDLAKELFDQQVAYVDSVSRETSTGKTVAFFYISSSGYAVTRKSGDYVSRMIALAGGNNVFSNLGDPETATSTVALEMEAFYATAKDADFIIYNSTIGGEVSSLEDLLQKNSLLAEFKAVKNGNVWCTGKNLFQETTQLGLMISDIHEMLTAEDAPPASLHFLRKLQ